MPIFSNPAVMDINIMMVMADRFFDGEEARGDGMEDEDLC